MFLHERQSAWLQGLEGAFRHFGGTTREVLVDNARALVDEHDAQTREVRFNDRFHAFCRYWDVTAAGVCAVPGPHQGQGRARRRLRQAQRHRRAPLRPRWSAWQAHLARWMREVADVRVHGTTGEPPIARFERDERRGAATAGAPKAPFLQVRELTRRVHTDACIELDTNRYSVPWRLIGESVTVVVAEQQVRILHAGQEVACHAQSTRPARHA